MHGLDNEVIPLHPPFETVLRGFHRKQVVDHIEALEGRIAMVEADRDAALGQAAELAKVLEHLRREAEDATTRLALLQQSSLAGAGARIQRMLQLAEQELAELQASTQQEVNALRERTRAEADQLLGETTERCRRLEEEARAKAEEHQARAATNVYALLAFAGQRLRSSTAEAERRVAELTDLRTDVTSRLSSVHRRLADVLGHPEAAHPEAGHPEAGETDAGEAEASEPETGDLEARQPEPVGNAKQAPATKAGQRKRLG